MKRLMLSLTILSLYLFGCTANEENVEPVEPVGESIESNLFSLTVTAPSSSVQAGEDFEVTGTLKYNGEKPIELGHAQPPILLSIDEQGGGQEDMIVETEMSPGEELVIKSTFNLTEQGTYSLRGATTTLTVDGEYIEGAGYEELMDEAPAKFHSHVKSVLAIEPVQITVE
ncbi:hypothetical protein [Planococcus lenghuensis]|uniref:YtkA-like domain-containing protein n=1 Tax=Planococcus lenghuensis TaxID=2213202 RepID=A0A1Q2L1C2_9BACL|nr:hypothetical protein [Planococcus lenghuensis]AQQ54239.1 hypothetical protein B0X71_14790 [Planococcus lenghuensis]